MRFLCSITDGIQLATAGTVTLIVLLAVMAVMAVGVNVLPRLIHKCEIEYGTRDITFGAVCLAMSYALSWITLFRMPLGGSVTPAALAPLFLYSYYFGFRKGMAVSCAYMLLQFTQGVYIISPWSAFFDYIFPGVSICTVGLFAYNAERYSKRIKKSKSRSGVKGRLSYIGSAISGHRGLFAGAAVHTLIRYLSSAFSGILFFGEWAPVQYGPFAWGFLYNTVLLADSAVAVAACALLLSSRTFNTYMSATLAGKKSINGKAEESLPEECGPAASDSESDAPPSENSAP